MDPIEIIAKEIVKQSIPSASFFKAKAASIASKIHLVYEKYLISTYEKNRKINTIISKNEKINVEETFQAKRVKIQNTTTQLEKQYKIFEKSRKILIQGTAGCGKSTFLKSLLVNQVNDRLSRIPFFIELRRISDKDTIIAHIANDLRNTTTIDITESTIEACIKKGRFTLILDGFDEVPENSRQTVYQQIEELCFKYPDLQVIASSRPEQSIQNLVAFTTAEIMPLSKNDALSLIKKVPFNESIKNSFIKDLNESLYKKHETFASNPLLLLTMLLTYCETGEIPENLSLFFENAFSALYNRHDLTKDFFRRNIKSPLASDEFKDIFSYFSASTFFKYGVEFKDYHAVEEIRSAQKYNKKEFDPNYFLTDLLENVCLLVRDGLVLTYTHRTFQEYFAAKFLSKCTPEERSKAYPTVIPNIFSDQVAGFLYDLAPREVEHELIEPELKKICERPKPVTEDDFLDLATELLGVIEIYFKNNEKDKYTGRPSQEYSINLMEENRLFIPLLFKVSGWFSKSNKGRVSNLSFRECMDSFTTYVEDHNPDSFRIYTIPNRASAEERKFLHKIEFFDFLEKAYDTSYEIVKIINEKKREKESSFSDIFS